jgi:hypothetical protein
MKTLIGMKKNIFIIAAFLLAGCNLFPTAKCDNAPLVYDNGELYSDRGECNYISSPGFNVRVEVNFDYGAVQGQETNFKWKFSNTDFFISETNEQITGEFVNTSPVINVYSRYKDGVRSVITNIEVIAYNDCGESNPYTGTIEIIHNGDPEYGSAQNMRNLPPTSVLHHGQAYYNNELYILFGERKDTDKANYKFNFASNQWSALPQSGNIPAELYTDHYRQVHFSNKVYFFHNHGWHNGYGNHYCYNLDDHSLETIDEIPGITDYPGILIHQGLWPVINENKIYVGPYYHESGQYAIASLDPINHQWEIEFFMEAEIQPKPLVVFGRPYPETRNFGQMAVVVNNQLLYRMDNIGWHVYDFVSKTGQHHQPTESLTNFSAGVSSFAYNNKGYLFTASDYGAGDLVYLYETEIISPVLNEAFTLQGTSCFSKSWNGPTYGARVTIIDNVPYYVAGQNFLRISMI